MLSMQISSYYRLKGDNLWFDEVDASCEKYMRTVYTRNFNSGEAQENMPSDTH